MPIWSGRWLEHLQHRVLAGNISCDRCADAAAPPLTSCSDSHILLEMFLVADDISPPSVYTTISNLPDLIGNLTDQSEVMTHKDQATIPLCIYDPVSMSRQ